MCRRSPLGSRSTILVFLLLFLVCSFSFAASSSDAARDPAQMSDQEILAELSQIYSKQAQGRETALNQLQQAQQMLDLSRTKLETLQTKLTEQSLNLAALQGTINASTTSLQNSINAMETNMKRLRTQNAWLAGGLIAAIAGTVVLFVRTI